MSKVLKIDWLGFCENCGSELPKLVTTEKGSDKFLYDGDKVVCEQCNWGGEIEADGENAWVNWYEE